MEKKKKKNNRRYLTTLTSYNSSKEEAANHTNHKWNHTNRKCEGTGDGTIQHPGFLFLSLLLKDEIMDMKKKAEVTRLEKNKAKSGVDIQAP